LLHALASWQLNSFYIFSQRCWRWVIAQRLQTRDITRLAKRANKPNKDTPTPLINKGRFSVGFGLRNLMRMDQQPILNCPGRRPGQFETGFWFIPMRFRSQNQSQTGPFSSKGLGCLPGRLNAERYERHCLYMPLIPNGSTWDVLGYKIEGP
jgi:hypothetical protein